MGQISVKSKTSSLSPLLDMIWSFEGTDRELFRLLTVFRDNTIKGWQHSGPTPLAPWEDFG